jgi:ABC-type Fe3+/spermidine/putrescine transport system ATPase subunit
VKIQIKGLGKSYGTNRIVDNLDLDIAEGEFFTLLGGSGSGKTTTLRLLAGLETPDQGCIRFDDRIVADSATGIMVPPERRELGLVFQSYALWPHMSVFDNLALGLRERRVDAAAVKRKVDDVLQLVGLENHAARYPHQLSGGQQQRVALARALAQAPSILLFDEPLSNLDAKLREQMRTEIRHLQQRLGITAVYVTHDQTEAMSMSDRIGIMANGRLAQVGAPAELYRAPASGFVANFFGLANLLPGRRDGDGVRIGSQLLQVADKLPASQATLMIRPEEIRFGAGDNAVSGRILTRTLLGNLVDYQVEARELGMSLRVQELSSTSLRSGEVTVSLPRESLRLID